jgi:hypothetical protein
MPSTARICSLNWAENDSADSLRSVLRKKRREANGADLKRVNANKARARILRGLLHDSDDDSSSRQLFGGEVCGRKWGAVDSSSEGIVVGRESSDDSRRAAMMRKRGNEGVLLCRCSHSNARSCLNPSQTDLLCPFHQLSRMLQTSRRRNPRLRRRRRPLRMIALTLPRLLQGR